MARFSIWGRAGRKTSPAPGSACAVASPSSATSTRSLRTIFIDAASTTWRFRPAPSPSSSPTPCRAAGLLSGSSGRPVDGFGIPAAYIGDEDCAAIVAAGKEGAARVHLQIAGEERRGARAGVTVLDVPGGSGLRVVISAHLDGHDLGRSALDNATGVVVALAAARALAPRVSAATHGLRVCLFSAEEWALAGSARYLADMDPLERGSLALDINLDTVGGDDHLTALVSDFPGLVDFTAQASRLAGVPVESYLPLMPNSDHANFAAHGIPALRLVAGFDRPGSRVRHILSAHDQPEVVREEELRAALRVASALAWKGLTLPPAELAALRGRTEAKPCIAFHRRALPTCATAASTSGSMAESGNGATLLTLISHST